MNKTSKDPTAQEFEGYWKKRQACVDSAAAAWKAEHPEGIILQNYTAFLAFQKKYLSEHGFVVDYGAESR